MRNEQEKIISFNVDALDGVSVVHGYGITNTFPVHFHASFNLGMVESGEREFIYRGVRQRLKAEDIFVVQPFEPHSCCSTSGVGQSYKVLTFNADYSLFFPQLTINSPALLALLKEFHAIAEYEKASPKIEELYCQIIELLKSYASPNTASLTSSSNTNQILRAKQHIEKSCHLELSLKEMAEVACMSEYHFNRYFHRQYGLSPYAYYLVCKVKKAQRILTAHKSVASAAFDTGFFDQSHFSKLFKKHVGVPPGKFLKDNRLHHLNDR